ncbi:MAG: transporter substrate-binding domain-containing protein [Clostridium sp.]|nr:transporter substrate-binding domain-containing protein [Clostridium sp.]
MKKKFLALVLVSGLLLGTVGCSSTSSTSSTSKAKVIKIAGVNDAKPFTYVDESGNLSGYDGEVLQAINKKLPQYKFEYSGMDQGAMLLGVQTGKYDLGTCHLYKNADRAQKFFFPDQPFGLSDLRLVVKKGSNIKTLADMVGKKLVPIPANDARYTIMQDYNKAHPDKQVKLETIDSLNAADTFKMVASGQYDAAIYPAPAYEPVEKQLNLDIKLAGTVTKVPTYFVLNKKDTKLGKDIDKALKELKADGTLSKLSVKWYGEDVYKN